MDNQRKPALDQLTPQEKMARGSAWMTHFKIARRCLYHSLVCLDGRKC